MTSTRFLLLVVALSSLAVWCETGQTTELPVGAHTPAIDAPHFPDRAHAFVWRNCTLVEPQRLSTVLGTSVENVQQMAQSMGLPAGWQVCPRMLERGYMTLLRRNWHLLPYEQLLELLDMSAEKLDFCLREDDFAFIKLGSVKPRCEPVRFREPDQAVRVRAAEIKQTVQRYFGSLSEHVEQPRFSFVDQWNHVDESVTKSYDPSRMHEGLRCLYSYFGEFGDPLSDPTSNPYPNGLLAELADVGVNGVWMHVVLRQLAPGGEHFPEFGEGHERRLENLRRLVGQARKYGIGIYLYLNEPRAMPPDFFEERPEMAGISSRGLLAMCTSNKRVRQWLTNSTAHLFREVPDLAGVFTITASENPTNCAFIAGGQAACSRCRGRSQAEIVAEVNAAIEEGVHRGNPNARVIAWDWGWNDHGDASDTIAKLSKKIQLMSVSEWSLPIVRGGVESRVGEHAISAVGPGPRAKHHWSVARQRGLKTIANVHVNTTCELMSLPYLPVMDLVAQHAVNLSREQIDGVMLSWTMGGYPSPNLKVFQSFSQQPDTNIDDVLNRIARERYGEQAAEYARKAWSAFSQAFQEYPYHISVLYNGPQHMGPANLLYWKPTGYQATMVGIPYDDLKGWRGPYPSNVFTAQFNRVAAGWQEGLRHLEQVVAASDESKRSKATTDLHMARAARIHFASTANQARFIVVRDQLQADKNTDENEELLRRELTTILEREIDLSQQLYDLALPDARIGFEASCHYFYVPLDLVEKVINCEFLRKKFQTPD